MDVIKEAKNVFDIEIDALKKIRDNLGDAFVNILETVMNCDGKVILCGMGKSGHIARKISATLASLGTPSFFLHPGEAMHGDLGMVSQKDVVILISNSGETEEIVRLIPSLKIIGAKLVAITGIENSTLSRECNLTQIIDIEKEACLLNLAPTSSTTATLVYGDALAVVASMRNGFGTSDFGLYHPAGTLGKKVLLRVQDIMAVGEALPSICEGSKITEAIMEMSHKGLGTVAIVDEHTVIKGLLTDGDLRRAIEKKADLYEDIVDKIMTKSPKTIKKDILLVDALNLLRQNKLNNYPVVDSEGHLLGMLTWQMIIREGIAL